MRRPGLTIAALGLSLFVQTARADWLSPKRLTWTSGSAEAPAVAVDFWGNIHVVWEDDTPSPGSPEIYYRKSADGGAGWMPQKRLTWNTGDSGQPAIAIDMWGNLHVVWQDDTPGNGEIYYQTSQNGGISWSGGQRISWTAATSLAPAIAADGWGNLHVLWHDNAPGNYEICYASSTNKGATWSQKRRLTWTPGLSSQPAIAVDSAAFLHAAWADESPGNAEIFYMDSMDSGASWSTQRLTWNSGLSQAPSIAADPSGGIHVAWWDDTPGGAEIFYKKSPTGGATWTGNMRLTWQADDSQGPVMVVDSSGGLHLVWWDSQPGNAEIFYQKSTNGGAAWTTKTRLTWSSGNSYGPAIAVDYLGNLHVVWYDNTAGDNEVYYRKFVK